ncbi:hypothetical protein PtA15_11A423 [Puccinia triticina]|uniref:Myosin-binding domain-containing protein n=1 Tax=Puccinia triticina TaxID=208348 RepID=A0ABY7D0G7_9BASI|nr:uncharacterized protein PtA15_11A423 [Puccinia triticina]WAQ89732.1 hypothetical protein PtA15_11A423 [Puccinia triticina]WAR59779.1 hypothetical protein PtB15_11B420 [Puccinia triticina]
MAEHASSPAASSSGEADEQGREPERLPASSQLRARRTSARLKHNRGGEAQDDAGNQPTDRLSRFRGSFFALLATITRLVLWPFRYILTTLLPHTLAGLAAAVVLVTAGYLLTSTLQGWVTSRLLSPLGVLGSTLSTPLVSFYCASLHGPFCGSAGDDGRSGKDLAQIARTVSGSAQKAADIFDSVVQLSDPNHLGLHQAEILELSFAIRWSTQLADKELLGDGLAELAELSRDLKDNLVDLNGQGLNTFSFIAYEFSRLGDLMQWVQSGEKKYTSETIARNLEILFSHLSAELSRLLAAIEVLIPRASRAVHLGIQLSERLHHEHYQLANKKSSQTLWKKLLDLASFSGQQLNRDLALTAESIANLKRTWAKLEQIRTDLLTYRNNVANFKASFTGWHLADHQLSPEDELFSMREVIARFRLTIQEVKASARLPYAPAPAPRLLADLPPEPGPGP